MIDSDLVSDWVREEGNEVEGIEDPENEWRLRVEYPRERGRYIDLVHLPDRETLIIMSTHDLDDEGLQESAPYEQVARFHDRLKLDFLRSPFEYRLEFDDRETGQVIERFAITKTLYSEDITKAGVFRALSDVQKGVLLVVVHLQLLRREVKGEL